MSNVAVQKVNASEKNALPIFSEISKRWDEVRCRAHDLFQLRSGGMDLELWDWLTAEREVFGEVKAELAEKDNSYEIQVALPGFEPGDIQVTVAPEEIVVRAATERVENKGKTNVVWTEFGSSEVYRRLELPRPVLQDKAVAKLDKGILHITAPCASQTQPVAAERQKSAGAA